jgi:hypothetical protein
MQGLGRTSDSADRSAQYRQVRALGGDCYDFVPLIDHRLGLVVGDASGKGVAAALMIASVQSSLRTAALFTGNDPGRLTQDSESSGIRFVARGPLCDSGLRCLRQVDADAAVRECWTLGLLIANEENLR